MSAFRPTLSRRDFLESFLPSRANALLAWRIVKWSFYAGCLVCAYQLFARMTFDGWKFLGRATIVFALPVLMIGLFLGWIGGVVQRSEHVWLKAGARGLVSLANAICLMALGAFLYHQWTRDPREAAITVVVLALVALLGWFSRRPEGGSDKTAPEGKSLKGMPEGDAG